MKDKFILRYTDTRFYGSHNITMKWWKPMEQSIGKDILHNYKEVKTEVSNTINEINNNYNNQK